MSPEGGAERSGVLFRAAGHDPAPDALLAHMEKLLGLDAADALRYVDARHGQRRSARLVRAGSDAHLEAVLLGGDTRAEAWIKPLLQQGLPAQALGRQLLHPGATAPAGVSARGKVVCSCFGVSESAIGSALRACAGSEAERLAALQGSLRCGTNCGSCVPELKRMVRAAVTSREAVGA